MTAGTIIAKSLSILFLFIQFVVNATSNFFAISGIKFEMPILIRAGKKLRLKFSRLKKSSGRLGAEPREYAYPKVEAQTNLPRFSLLKLLNICYQVVCEHRKSHRDYLFSRLRQFGRRSAPGTGR